MRYSIVALALVSPALALPTWPSDSAESVGVYDFVIVGGGTAGLVIANRLSENTNMSVAVIEAGDLVFDNKNVTKVDGYGLALNTQLDWQYQSTPQLYTGNRTQTLSAGKAVGGTSTINGKRRRV
jgi:choline dehydrogenase-like flavoprotein